jgi:hypothetical protein
VCGSARDGAAARVFERFSSIMNNNKVENTRVCRNFAAEQCNLKQINDEKDNFTFSNASLGSRVNGTGCKEERVPLCRTIECRRA